MSHFTVLVIGDNIEEQLQPFHEFECTGENDQYVQDMDITQDILDRMAGKGTGSYNDNGKREDGEQESLRDALGWYGLEDRIVKFESEADKDGDHKFGYAVVQDGQLIRAIKRTNPNSKWDWYQIGGRWTGFFKLKKNGMGITGEPGLMTPRAASGYADQAMKGDIDWIQMRAENVQEAQKRYRLVESFYGGVMPKLELTWKELVEREDDGMTLDEKRDLYNNQELLKKARAYRKDDELGSIITWGSLEPYLTKTEEEYVTKYWNSAVTPFAVLKDGIWYEKGKMGWWAMVSDAKSAEEWETQVSELLEQLPNNTLLSVVDCHI